MPELTRALWIDEVNQINHNIKTALIKEGFYIEEKNNLNPQSDTTFLLREYDALVLSSYLPVEERAFRFAEKALNSSPELNMIVIADNAYDHFSAADYANLGVRGYLTRPLDIEKLVKK